MLNDIKNIEKYADTMIETGTRLKEFLKEDFLNKPEVELTSEEKDKYYQFVGFFVSSAQKLNEIRLEF
jgi:hypothetical protein